MENKEILTQNSINELSKRLNTVMDYALNKDPRRYKNQTLVAEAIGFQRSNLNKALKGEERYLTENIVEKFSDEFPELNKNWLLTGEGEMLNNEKHTEGTEVLILPVSAEGGRLDGFSTQVRTEDCETIISPIKDVDFAMTVSGDSMYPEYPSGSKILVKKINEKAFIDWGRVYVLDTCNGAVIKKIMPGSTEDKVKCLSINEEYPPFEVAFNDIFGMYRVLMCMSLK